MARFPRLKEIRERELGWEVVDLVYRLPDKRPGTASIYRLEAGGMIRVPNARKIFDVLNKELNGRLVFDDEIMLVKPED